MSFSVRKTLLRFSLTRVKTSPNSGVRWWMIGIAPAAETSGGMGVGPGDIKRYLFIIGFEVSSRAADNSRPSILATIVRDGYILGQSIYKLLLSRRASARRLADDTIQTTQETPCSYRSPKGGNRGSQPYEGLNDLQVPMSAAYS